MQKKGISSVVTTLLLILVSMIAIGIVWVIVANLISEHSELSKTQVELYFGKIRFHIVDFDVTGSQVNVSLRNMAGKIKPLNETELPPPPTIDVISVTDVSGSMRCSSNVPLGDTCYNDQNICENSCGGVWMGPINSSKQANRNLIATIFENPNARIGFVVYSGGIIPAFSHELSNNSLSLNSAINLWDANGGTCICCGIEEAESNFLSNSFSEIKKAMIIMSDGIANGGCGLGGSATEDAVTAACNANSSLENLTIYSVGLGDAVDEATLQAIANCGNGSYYAAENIDDLASVYETIAEELEVEYEAVNSFSGVLFLFYNETHSVRFLEEEVPSPLEIDTYEFNLNGILTPPIIRIEIYPVIYDSDGDEIIGPLMDSWDLA